MRVFIFVDDKIQQQEGRSAVKVLRRLPPFLRFIPQEAVGKAGRRETLVKKVPSSLEASSRWPVNMVTMASVAFSGSASASANLVSRNSEGFSINPCRLRCSLPYTRSAVVILIQCHFLVRMIEECVEVKKKKKMFFSPSNALCVA